MTLSFPCRVRRKIWLTGAASWVSVRPAGPSTSITRSVAPCGKVGVTARGLLVEFVEAYT